jgi:hypothetical protein
VLSTRSVPAAWASSHATFFGVLRGDAGLLFSVERRGPTRIPSLPMGLIWDLIQHGQIADSKRHAQTLEQRIERLEGELRRTNDTLVRLLRALEHRFGEDLDGDKRIG